MTMLWIACGFAAQMLAVFGPYALRSRAFRWVGIGPTTYLQLREHAQAVWVAPDDLLALDWAEADIPVLGAVQAWLRRGAPKAD